MAIIVYMKSLMRLETWIEQLVEEPFVRLFAGQLLPQDVATHLVRAMEDSEHLNAEGDPEVPGCYTIVLNPNDLAALRIHHPDVDQALAEALESLVEHMNIHLRSVPTIILQADSAILPRGVQILATDAQPAEEPTHDLPAAEPTRDLGTDSFQALLEKQEKAAPPAYLVIQGKRAFDLLQPLIRIGRALDNDLILEERNVSRYHAQLRLRYGRYILQDLNSSGGTIVNGFPVQEIVLRPGDVISLCGVEILYVEGLPEADRSTPPKGDTKPYPPTES